MVSHFHNTTIKDRNYDRPVLLFSYHKPLIILYFGSVALRFVV